MTNEQRAARIAALERELAALRGPPSVHGMSCDARRDDAHLCTCGARRHADTPGWWDLSVHIPRHRLSDGSTATVRMGSGERR